MLATGQTIIAKALRERGGKPVARFDIVANRYDAFCATPLGSFVEAVEHQIVSAVLDPRPGERVVDLGCGTGTSTLWLADAGCMVVGVDESQAMLVIARNKKTSAGRMEWVHGDLTQLPWASASFDAGLIQVALEFVDQPAVVLTEALRVIKPGGRLVLGLIQGTGPWAHHYRMRAQADPTSVYHGAHFWTLPELARLMAMNPSQVRGGLFVGPTEFRTGEQAWAWESRYRAVRPLADAGFLAVRYERPMLLQQPNRP